ncbi:separase isoform X2 [Euphorbia lathyris]|uniref:separase isoform X2 n=1 Tax=Euphorbia lathyris TaxID=212925 RepID=UPI00331387C6
MASLTEPDLISKLETSTSTPIFSIFSDYLILFADLRNPNKPKPLNQTQIQTLKRSLAKQFLPFLNRSLSIIPKRLSDLSKLHCHESKATPTLAVQLFDTYRLCIECLELVASELSCELYKMSLHRLRLIYCLEAWGLYKEAENEGFGVLERLRDFDMGEKERKKKGIFGDFLPGPLKIGDTEFAKFLVEVVVAIVKCVALGNSKEGSDYRRVLALVEEVKQWFRVLDANVYEKLHRVLLTYLRKSTLFLVGELINCNGDLVHAFCEISLKEYAESSLKDQMYKFAHQICSTLFLLHDGRLSYIIGILKCVLDFLASKCKVKEQNQGIEFIQLVSYCANKCQTESSILCSSVAEHLNDLAFGFYQAMEPLNMILRLYAIGLAFTDCTVKSRTGDFTSSRSAKDEPAASFLLSDGVIVGNLAPLLGSLKSYFFDVCKDNCLSCRVETPLACTQKSRRVYLLVYFNALKFLCQPLSELVNLEKKQIASANGVASTSALFFSIREVFDQFLDVFLFLYSTASEREGSEFVESNMVISIAVAAFTLFIRTKLQLQSIHLIKHIISSEWIQPQGLKYILSSLYKLGVYLYRDNQISEASKALKLSCRASWTCTVLLCQMFMNKSNGLTSDVTENGILDFVMETCTRTAFLLDVHVLSKCSSLKLEKIIVRSLENWSIAEDLFRRLPGPVPLVKQWVKIECKRHKNLEVEDKVPGLYHLLTSSQKLSKRTISKILQQELLAYEEMENRFPELCRRMQIEIIDVLLRDAYVTPNCHIERSRILLKKGQALRACGFDGLVDCIQCLSEVISIINGEKCNGGSPTCQQLAVAYGLRALCTQESEPNSKQILQDIKASVNLWLSILVSNDDSIPETTVSFLYNIVDLLAVKGSMEFHYEIYKVITIIYKRKSLPVEKFLSILWESRRLSHALCIAPVYDELLNNFANEFGEQVKSTDFWMQCLNVSLPSLVGFQQNFSYLFTSIPSGSCNHGNSFPLDITVDDVKRIASELISKAPLTSDSVFFAGCLYYDLSEKLIATGYLFEALSYAKEAHRLRTKLLQEKFTYSVKQRIGQHVESEDPTEKLTSGLHNLLVNKSIARELWCSNGNSFDGEVCYLSPWKVLQCYLESTLQVGVIHEIIGNGGEAETFLIWGKDLSCQQSLSPFIVAFSTVLGKLYRKKRSWDLSEKELQKAKQILADSITTFSCLKCRLMLEVNVDMQLADLYRNRIFLETRNVSMQRLSPAESLYKSSLYKLILPEWRNSVSCPQEVEDRKNCACSASTQPDIVAFVPTKPEANARMKDRKCRQTKNAARCLLKEQTSITECNTRLTRSRYRSSQSQSANSFDEVQLGLSKHLNGNHEYGSSDTINRGKSVSEMRSKTVNLGSGVACICNNMKCWFCLAGEVKQSGSLINFIHMKWELLRRQLCLRVLSGRGKCLELHGQIHEAHENILHSVSVLVSRNPFTQTDSPVSFTFLLDLVGREFAGDVFAIERATLLYNICWFSLKNYQSKDNRTTCCDLSSVQLEKIVSWLMLAFVLCREIPVLFQKVSRLISVIYTLSSSSELFSLPSHCKVLSEGHWASYFHQASLGTHLTYQFFSSATGKCKAEHLTVDQGSKLTSSTLKGAESCSLPRLAPKSVEDLEHFVTEFFSNIPCTTIICISLIGGSCAALLQELLSYPSPVHAWMLLSRLSFKSQPLVILLPLDLISEEVSEEEAANYGSGEFPEGNVLGKSWHCPWSSAFIDEVAPMFRFILEENYSSSSISPLEDTKENRTLWWLRRKTLDSQLGYLLRKLEDVWFGPWRYVLLGELSNFKHLDSVQKKLVSNLKSKCKLDVSESILKVILGGGRYALDGEAFIFDLLLSRKGCFIGKGAYSEEEMCETLVKETGAQKLSDLAIQLIYEAVNELEEDFVNREPLILVLDSEVQMIPWENLPVLRNQEVYRMPSVGSIFLTLDRSCKHQDQVGNIVAAFPLIDPLDAFYLLNPSGDLSSTQVEFENWFRDQNLEGKAGSAPTAEELSLALKSHDLFLYFGHGSGAQYISQQEIQKLENCAATLLMGCSSGALTLNGSYIPQGTPLSYLLAGSPIIIANLWEVTDKDIDRFGKAMLDAWLKERSCASIDCAQCNSLAKEFEAMNLRDRKGKSKKKVEKKKEAENCASSDSLMNFCNHKPKIGSFMSRAREACRLPYLIGASPVCYGVPTGIRKKDL